MPIGRYGTLANKSLYVHNGLTVGQSVQINGSSGGISTTGIVTSTNTTNASSTVTGALQIAGGVGIGRDLYVGGTIYGAAISGAISSATNSTNAANIATVAQTANAAYFPTFVDSNNAASANELVYTTSSFSINPSTGFVGIGTTSPGTTLDVASTTSAIIRAIGTSIGRLSLQNSTRHYSFSAQGSNLLFFDETGGSTRATLTSAGNFGINVTPAFTLDVGGPARISGITTVTNTTAASSTVTGALIVNGGIGVGNNVYIAGALFATTKSFLIDHPTKPNKKLRYGSLEGPENGVYIRGRTQGAIIELPDYWTKLVDPESMTVNLTAIGKTKAPSVNKIEGNKIYLNKPWFSKIDCYYIIFAERADIEKLETEI